MADGADRHRIEERSGWTPTATAAALVLALSALSLAFAESLRDFDGDFPARHTQVCIAVATLALSVIGLAASVHRDSDFAVVLVGLAYVGEFAWLVAVGSIFG